MRGASEFKLTMEFVSSGVRGGGCGDVFWRFVYLRSVFVHPGFL